MDVLFHLTTLIKAHKEVGIPGLGTIYKKKSPGRYDASSHSFLPPSYLIHFTSDLKEDTLLTSLISEAENISADSATDHIEQFSQHILDELAEHQNLSFGQLGDFSIETGSLTFTSKKDQHFGFEFYGLPALSADLAPDQEIQPLHEEPVHTEVTPEQLELENNNADLGDGTSYTEEEEIQAPPFVETPENIEPEEEPVEESYIVQEEQPDEQIQTIVETPVFEDEPAVEEEQPVAEHEPVAEEEQPVEETEAVADDNTPFVLISESPENKSSASSFYVNSVVIPEQKTPVYRNPLIWVLIIFILAALVGLLKPDLFKGLMSHQDEVTIDMTKPPVQKTTVPATADSIPAIDTAAIADSIRISDKKPNANIDSSKKTVAVPVPANHSTNAPISYEILAASLANQKEADNFLADMKKRGIPAKIADLKGRRIKITLGTFADEQEARKQLQILKETTKLPGIYIFPNRHTKQH
ncbi:SPOR domain-containing protein [Pedobacter sp. MC2016-24]|uniref:HU domain-containing protein n=1 Tax=Pedobacter sp. MC2016-24 TaxID=2780090 RepID=UPI00187E2F99|nr:SPOR domain-containing protein [Pedobacter sp. MC2016-24]MBE9601208.1 SPOR domain-containing protein [Pedobacter sp. MC2016-24]